MNVDAFGKTFDLINEEKFSRATQGMISRGGQLVGGVGVDASGEAIIAEYDRLAGAIRLNGDKVKRGCFYDFPKKKPIEEPEIRLEFMINGKRVDVLADEPLPPMVRAAKETEQGNHEAAAEATAAEEGSDEKPRPVNLIGAKGRRTRKFE